VATRKIARATFKKEFVEVRRFLLVAAIFALIGGSFAYLLATKSTYVFLNYESYAMETSLWFFIIVLVLGYFLFNLLVSLLTKLYRPGHRFNRWANNRRQAVSKKEFFQGVLDYESGAWDKALKKFRAASKSLDRPIVAYLYAARAAHKLERRDIKEEMLHAAVQAEPKSALVVGLVRAELLLAEKNEGEAKKVLQGLQLASPKNHQIENLLARLP